MLLDDLSIECLQYKLPYVSEFLLLSLSERNPIQHPTPIKQSESDIENPIPYSVKPAVWAQILKNAFNIPTHAVLSICQQPNTISNSIQAQCSNDFWLPGEKGSDFEPPIPYSVKPAMWVRDSVKCIQYLYLCCFLYPTVILYNIQYQTGPMH